MDDFIRRQNLERFRHLLAEERDDAQRQRIAKLLAEEEAKDRAAQDGKNAKSN